VLHRQTRLDLTLGAGKSVIETLLAAIADDFVDLAEQGEGFGRFDDEADRVAATDIKGFSTGPFTRRCLKGLFNTLIYQTTSDYI